MMRSLLYVLLTLSALGIASAPASAAELTNPPVAERSDATADLSSGAKMPPGADFSNGPTGGGAQLMGTDHIQTGAEFSNGPTGISQE